MFKARGENYVMSTFYFQGAPAIHGNFPRLGRERFGREQGISESAQPEDFGQVRNLSQDIGPKCP